MQMLSLASLHPPLCCRVSEEAAKTHIVCRCSGFLLTGFLLIRLSEQYANVLLWKSLGFLKKVSTFSQRRLF